jgi:methylated-DNA-protein-cysteine methyltransferase-like protein
MGHKADFSFQVYRMVQKIPLGQVTTYGTIATLIYSPRAARAVGQALRASSWGDLVVPWHRVINAQGKISIRGELERPVLQRLLLEEEGIPFDRCGRVDLEQYGWWG